MSKLIPSVPKLTPSEVNCIYSIPIYQRLFEWNADDDGPIIRLLDDLKKSFEISDGKDDYYIGMLTSTADNELVDGQQRFTVMMLMGCVFQHYFENWKNFLIDKNEKIRLHFSSRPADNTYLESLINQEPDNNIVVVNKKMASAVEAIKDYLDNKFTIDSDRRKFADYVYNNLCFFVTQLPERYSSLDLNKYFERMNTAGRDMEQHEILKVKLLSNLDNGDVEKYMSLWNKLADVDTLLVRKREDEKEDDYKKRKCEAFQFDIDKLLASNIINGLESDQEEKKQQWKKISSVEPSANKPVVRREINRDSHCALSFPYLLLQALFRYFRYKDKEGYISCSIEEFFKPSNLLKTFEKHLPYDNNPNKDDIKSFMQILLRGKLALDICFVRPSEFGYILDMNLDESNPDLKNLMMYESMLLVSSSNATNYRWFGWVMDAIEIAENSIPDANKLFAYLKQQDEELHKLPQYDELSYGNDIRYWFWKLDFYIWQNKQEIFKESKDALDVAENYVFRRNRSIEHIAPQTPQHDSTLKWGQSADDTKLRDSFGNLVMISQGLNSALQNESYEVKKAHVQSFINRAKSGSIESLKLLIAYLDETWDKKAIEDHGKKMYDFLQKSFEPNEHIE